MDFLNTIERAFVLRWDILVRLTASIMTIASVVGFQLMATPLQVIAGLFRAVDWEAGWSALLGAHDWVVARESWLVWVGGALIAVGLVLAYWSPRGGAVGLIGAALVIEVGNSSPIWILLVLLILMIVAFFVSRVVLELPLMAISEAIWRVLINTFLSAIFIPVAPITWIVDPPRRHSY